MTLKVMFDEFVGRPVCSTCQGSMNQTKPYPYYEYMCVFAKCPECYNKKRIPVRLPQ